MDTFNPRYQLEAEEQAVGRRRSALNHQEIERTLHALDHLARRLRRERVRRQRWSGLSR